METVTIKQATHHYHMPKNTKWNHNHTTKGRTRGGGVGGRGGGIVVWGEWQ